MKRHRILVVDDSAAMRALLRLAIQSDPDLEVIGVAPNGRIALDKLSQLQPDALTLDVEMPVLDGLQTLRELRSTHPQLPVVMCSTLTERGSRVTIEALLAGANDYVAKPSTPQGGREELRQTLVPRLRALLGLAPDRVQATAPAPALPVQNSTLGRLQAGASSSTAQDTSTLPRPQDLRLLVIGVSTGGPAALARLVPQLSSNLRVPVAIVQHMPPLFTRTLAERLDGLGPLRVSEAEGGEELRPGQALIAPGGKHLVLERAVDRVRARLTEDPPENSCRPAVDVLFRSAADVHGSGVLAVVLTGMGNDGERGCQCVRAAGGGVLAQDEASSVVWGMPGAVARAGLAHRILGLDELAQEINALVGAPSNVESALASEDRVSGAPSRGVHG